MKLALFAVIPMSLGGLVTHLSVVTPAQDAVPKASVRSTNLVRMVLPRRPACSPMDYRAPSELSPQNVTSGPSVDGVPSRCEESAESRRGQVCQQGHVDGFSLTRELRNYQTEDFDNFVSRRADRNHLKQQIRNPQCQSWAGLFIVGGVPIESGLADGVHTKKSGPKTVTFVVDKGTVNGEVRTWNPQGILLTVEHYREGVLDGVRERYDDNGNHVMTEIFDKGVCIEVLPLQG